jgi:IclR family acetate operon transcriptional repressor
VPEVAHVVDALVSTGHVQFDDVTREYAATVRLGVLGLRQVESIGVDVWAQPTLDRLAGKTHELVRLAMVSGGRLHFIAKAQGSNSQLTLDNASGTDTAPHATAFGKAWLAMRVARPSRSRLPLGLRGQFGPVARRRS